VIAIAVTNEPDRLSRRDICLGDADFYHR
jgi:hypothetical protein